MNPDEYQFRYVDGEGCQIKEVYGYKPLSYHSEVYSELLYKLSSEYHPSYKTWTNVGWILKQPMIPSTCNVKNYKCSDCGKENVQLWRQYQTCVSALGLLCFECALKDQKEKEEDLVNDCIGWLVPAVPSPCGETYWGYSSIPSDGCRWWYNLPRIRNFGPEYCRYSTEDYLRYLYQQYLECDLGTYIKELFKNSFINELKRTRFFDIFLTPAHCIQIPDLNISFTTKQKAIEWADETSEPSVIDFRF